MFSFLTQAVKNTYHTGSVWPSSKALARVMTRSMRKANGPRRILEVGPGTGPFTRHVLKALRDGDEFHVVEINETFCNDLETRLFAPYRAANPGSSIHLHAKPIEETDVQGRFDFIICGLPFNNFPPSLVRSIFRRMIDLLAPDGDLSYFEYAAVRVFKAPVAGRSMRHNMRRLDAHAKSLARRHSGQRTLVMANIPPAVAVRLHGLPETS